MENLPQFYIELMEDEFNKAAQVFLGLGLFRETGSSEV